MLNPSAVCLSAVCLPYLVNRPLFVVAVLPCVQLNLMSTMGIAANALCKLPLGLVLDKCGPRFTAILGGALVAAGSLLVGYGDRQSVLHMAGGYFMLGVAGPFVQMPCFQFSELYGRAPQPAPIGLRRCMPECV